ncbi:MAG: VTT domain-containing protein [Geminicoccaceae bacterium]|nr:VTT domain-containing protein [Geminicoccaceae bacterium]
MRLVALFLGLALLVVIPFLIWGEGFESLFTGEGAVRWLGDYGRWAWLVGVGLLIGDLVLPLPATAIISALGYLYGLVLGGLIGFAGSFLAGALGYGLCRMFGRGAARRILGARDLERGERLFRNAGGWLVVLSRWLPVFPEVIACMAGLTRMPAGRFFTALACGSLPLGFAFAAVGAAGVAYPGLALALSALAPPALWLVVRPFFMRRQRASA